MIKHGFWIHPDPEALFLLRLTFSQNCLKIKVAEK